VDPAVSGPSFEHIKQPSENVAIVVLALDPMGNTHKVPVTGMNNPEGHRAASYC